MAASAKVTWHPERVIDHVMARSTSGMEKAVEFVASQAKAHAPTAGGGRVSASLKTKVTVRGHLIEGTLYTDWFVSRFHELGTSKMRARPFMRPAVLNNGAHITRLITGG